MRWHGLACLIRMRDSVQAGTGVAPYASGCDPATANSLLGDVRELLLQEASMSGLVRLAAASAILFVVAQPVATPPVSAQGTPEANRYGGRSQDYAGQLTEVVAEIDTYWQGVFAASGAAYHSPAVTPLNGPVNT